jgi:hypothetical protein
VRRPGSTAWLAASLVGCLTDNTAATGLQETPDGDGPAVVFDLDASPLPEIPFPNDLATRYDATSPTGRRVNISVIAPSHFEHITRDRANQMAGFGTYAAMSVRFDAPLDLGVFERRHHGNLSFDDDAVFVVDIDPDSEQLCEPRFLDLGRGNFPLTLRNPDAFFPLDPRSTSRNLVFETVNEDLNGNNVLDPGEDTDFDGHLDVANTRTPDGDPVDDLLTYYENETNTLMIRPLVPLRPTTRYAVVLTTRLTGEGGQPVRSPFPFVHHTRQTDALRPLLGCLRSLGLNNSDIAFTWSFTTQPVHSDLDTIRAGLYGQGPLSRFAEEFPAEPAVVRRLRNEDADGPPGLIYYPDVRTQFGLMAEQFASGGESGVQRLLDGFENVDYIVAFEVEAPNFLVDRGPQYSRHLTTAPSFEVDDDDEAFELNPVTGEALYGHGRMLLMCTVPRERPGITAPFPVTLFVHGTGQNKFIMLGFAGLFARYGIATCGIDAVGHSFVLGEEIRGLMELLFGNMLPFIDMIEGINGRDLDNDGVIDPGRDFWTADAFHSRDMVRQTVVNMMQLVRVLRAWDGTRTWSEDPDGDPSTTVAGDFNGDGVVDMGGPGTEITAWGISLGGIVVGTLGGSEPYLTALSTVSGGGGLADIGVRSTQSGVPEHVHLPMIGPIFLGRHDDTTEETVLVTLAPLHTSIREIEFARSTLIRPGMTVRIENLVSGANDWAIVAPDGSFRLQVAADAPSGLEIQREFNVDPAEELQVIAATDSFADHLSLTVTDADGTLIETIDRFAEPVEWLGIIYEAGAPLVATHSGTGYHRNSPDVRRVQAISETVLEPGDPIVWAPRYLTRPHHVLAYDPDVPPATNALIVVTVGDTNVPVQTGIALARSVGIVDFMNTDPRYGMTQNELLIQLHVMEGIGNLERFPGYDSQLADVDDLDRSLDGIDDFTLDPPLRLTIQTVNGVSGLRLPVISVGGGHAYHDPSPDLPFDIHTFMANQLAWFFATGGTEIVDDICLEDESCDFIPPNAEAL